MATSALRPRLVQPSRPVANAGAHGLLLYFALAFLGTWIAFVPLIIDSTLTPDRFGFLFVLSTFSGPALAAIVATAVTSGRTGLGQLLKRLLRWRVGIQWYVAALFGFMAVWFAGYSIALDGGPIQALLAQPHALLTVFLPFVLTTSLLPAIGEELGWRGFALPQLQQRFGPVAGTLILGLLHSLWHLPAFFTPVLGPFVPIGFVTFVITGIAGTFIYTWIFNHARQSILIAVLIHAASNGASVLLGVLAAGQMPTNETAASLIASGWFNPVLFGTVALVLVIVTRGRLAYRPQDAE